MTAPCTVAKYQRQVYIGDAGSTASTQVLTLLECDVKKPMDFSPTDIRGDGTEIPVSSEQPVMRKLEVTFKCRNEPNGTNAALTAALLAYATSAKNYICALKTVSYPGGPTEVDCDGHLEVNDPDSRELEFTFHPSRQGGRQPSF